MYRFFFMDEWGVKVTVLRQCIYSLVSLTHDDLLRTDKLLSTFRILYKKFIKFMAFYGYTTNWKKCLSFKMLRRADFFYCISNLFSLRRRRWVHHNCDHMFATNQQLRYMPPALDRFSRQWFHRYRRQSNVQLPQTFGTFIHIRRWIVSNVTKILFFSRPHFVHILQHHVPIFVKDQQNASDVTQNSTLFSRINLRAKWQNLIWWLAYALSTTTWQTFIRTRVSLYFFRADMGPTNWLFSIDFKRLRDWLGFGPGPGTITVKMIR